MKTVFTKKNTKLNLHTAPKAFKQNGIGVGKKITSYPTSKDKLVDNYNYQEDRVVVDGTGLISECC